MHKSGHESLKIPPLRLLAWETTRRCNLACLHCRAAAGSGPYPGELTTDEGLTLLDDLATMGQPVVILTGGEPLLRDDIFELAAHGHNKGLRMVMAVNGTLLTPQIATRLKEVGIQRLSISIDGASAASHDQLRAVPGGDCSSVWCNLPIILSQPHSNCHGYSPSPAKPAVQPFQPLTRRL